MDSRFCGNDEIWVTILPSPPYPIAISVAAFSPVAMTAPNAAATLDPVALTAALIEAKSVTPARGGVFDVLEDMLLPMGFEVLRTIDGQEPDGPVENLLAIRRGPEGSRHFAFAGHLDVVPPGEGWSQDAFTATRKGDLLYGRGAVDMKGAIAAFVAAIADIPREAGTLSLIITGDEEGPAVHGTVAIMEHMAKAGIKPDLCLVGEPTSVNRLGDMMKIGRRGSVNIWITVPGVQGHVAYPHLADNPIPKLVRILARIDGICLDEGTDWFQPSNIEITDMAVGNQATNVIPSSAQARLSIRFNDLHSGEALAAMVTAIVHDEEPRAEVIAKISGEAFLTPPGDFSAMIADAIREVTGVEPELSTSGGTSDARFLTKIVPVVEFGLVNATMHKLDEAVAVADLHELVEIYRRVVVRALA